jgi:hypothetical protein
LGRNSIDPYAERREVERPSISERRYAPVTASTCRDMGDAAGSADRIHDVGAEKPRNAIRSAIYDA